MTQLDLAERTGLSEAAVRSYELGARNPKDAHRKAIADALGVSADYLREHDIRDTDILFLHTGGLPLFFDYLERARALH